MTAEPVSTAEGAFLLPERLSPTGEPSGLDQPYHDAVRESRLVVQHCRSCGAWQWGPEWICYSCQSFDLAWDEVPTTDGAYRGSIYSWERVWHPIEPALVDAVPYVAVLVSLPSAGGIRMLGNLVGDPLQEVEIGAAVEAVFEHHDDYTLVHWARG
jgi:uncharacterized OB-fold protein